MIISGILFMVFSILLMLILIIRISPFTKVKGRLKISLCGMLTGVLCSEMLHYIFDNIPSNKRYSLNLLTIGIASILTFAVTWVALEWHMRRQLASYKKTSGDYK
jgi:branched-subunit amino acid transport protein AzlD